MGRIGSYEERQDEMKTPPVLRKRDRVGIIIQFGDHNSSIMDAIHQTMSTCRISSSQHTPYFRQAPTKAGSHYPDGFYVGKWEGVDVAIWLQHSYIRGDCLRHSLGVFLALMGDEQRMIVLHAGASGNVEYQPGEVRMINKMMGDGVGGDHLLHNDPDVWTDFALPHRWAGGDFDKLRRLVMGQAYAKGGSICVNHVCFKGPLWPADMLWRSRTQRTAMTDPAHTIGISPLSKIADLIAIENHDREVMQRIALAPCVYIDRKMFEIDRVQGFSWIVPPTGNQLKKVVGTIRRLCQNDWIPEHLR